ncbi:MAG: uroporphyrinogen decarboxylase [Thermodesulfovibrionales bacterium]|nr:uroporphyrinogen decarboxylase [Thermodesulfovibrionales bacterium]
MNDTFVKACKGEKTPFTPIWIMRQAGRYLPEYQKIREKVDFLTLCKTPDLAVEVTIQPLQILGVDAAILFSDILIPLEPMGFDLEFSEKIGPVIHNPIRNNENLSEIMEFHPETLPFITETIKILKKSINVPLIGFSGAPFTLATYVIEGGSSKNFINTKRMIYGNNSLFEEIMERLTVMVKKYLILQIDAGVDAIQIFDTWLGILTPEDISIITSTYTAYLIDEIRNYSNIPIIYFPYNCAVALQVINELNFDVLGIDWRIDISDVIKIVKNSKSIQGNLDPCVLMGSKDTIKKRTEEIINSATLSKGHIFNLGHGVLPETPVDNVKYLVDIVHKLSQKEE